jgi:riboflavin kinase / FMN adenylyltransferase
MKIMRNEKDNRKAQLNTEGQNMLTYIALGFFDGVHLGHQTLLNYCIEKAKEDHALSTVILFNPHPAKVVHRLEHFFLLTTLSERIKKIRQIGIQKVITIHFTDDFQKISAENFVKKILLEKFNMGAVFVGFNYHFGYQKKGDINLLDKLANLNNFKLYTIGPKKLNGNRKISSTIIKEQLKEGNIEKANKLLGYFYQLKGKVIYGDKRGNKILSSPTANLDIPKEKLLPKNGVYIAFTCYDGKQYQSLINVGTKPTFAPKQSWISVEIYIFNFNDNLYGKEISVSLLRRIRDEKIFPDSKELAQQIKKDKLIANDLFRQLDLKLENHHCF